MATTDTTVTVAPRCDAGDHEITGEVYEARTGNWLIPGDMVCVMLACADHAAQLGAHTRAWWELWLVTEGAAYGYSSLS